jgi:phosphate uptake regulator
MLRKTFETEIQQVKDDVLVLGSMVEQALLNTVEALKRDIKALRKPRADKLINKKRFDIENKLMVLIARNSRWRMTCACWHPRWRSSPSWSVWAITPRG